ncbi:uncharacterized protein SAPINGB_P005074 [Magnusiomyces paraingens]|uniref:Ceramide glucosyltransferase n=1 Tax=Magnusiomyces paraingens TaxID=2606893 RepID=A0A5E8C0R8_9ASCO|nr:uncharacterized protein SAPINGB_P005074 [Saprochaete ingens]VVT56465.1 unnamed protein product [Saprochaete ingens]
MLRRLLPIACFVLPSVATTLNDSPISLDLRNTDPFEENSSGHGIVISILGVILFIWYLAIILVSLIGVIFVRINNGQYHPPAVDVRLPRGPMVGGNLSSSRTNTNDTNSSNPESNDDEIEGVTILRPLKGIDTEMKSCLVSAFLQNYPKFEIIFCVESQYDPAIPIAQALIDKFPAVDAKLLIDTEETHYGPNPKVNNLAKGYKQAKYDIIWVLDSNVWVAAGAMSRSVMAFRKPGRGGRRIKLVHHLPLCVSLDSTMTASWGSKLDEMFMLTSHSKFYTAINEVAIAPCVTGKSNLYRRSDLDAAVAVKLAKKNEELIKKQYRQTERALTPDFSKSTEQSIPLSPCSASTSSTSLSNNYPNQDNTISVSSNPFSNESEVLPGTGIRNFAQYIAEDNMIAVCLWEDGDGRTRLSSDSVVQPLADVSLKGYWDRRVRWLRVRRYMVSAATYVEPTTESICSGIFGTFAICVLFLSTPDGLPRYWSWTWFLFHMVTWCVIDYFHFHVLLAFKNMDNVNRPYFVSKYFSPFAGPMACRPRSLQTWLPAWCLREVLAFPIWLTAMLGQDIYWRDRPFRILNDLSTEEIIE